jgi:hypothetical protein
LGYARRDLPKLLTPGKFMLDDDELLLDLGRQVHDRGQNDDERPGVLAARDLLLDGLKYFRGSEKPVEVLQDEQGSFRPLRKLACRTKHSQRVIRVGVIGYGHFFAGELQARVTVPESQPP